MAISAAPIFLRIGLGVTFLWAGLGKLLSEMPVQGNDAAILANMGADIGPGAPPQPLRVEPPAPVKEPAPTVDPKAPEPTPTEKPADKPADKPVKSLDGKKANKPPALLAMAPQGGTPPTTQNPTYTMADFPEPRPVKPLYAIALLIWKASHPAPDATGQATKALVPSGAGEGKWPIRLAWTAALSETLGGTLLLVGLFTRLSALTLAWTIGVACWLTVIGPAMQSGQTSLGFLPRHARFDVSAWSTPLWQLSLLTSALALFFAGPGGASLDSIIFARDPEPQPKPKSVE